SIELMREARSRGVDITFDQYPYTASSTGIGFIIPSWAHADDRLEERLNDPVERERVKEGMLRFIDERFGGDPSRVQLVNCDFDSTYAGKTIADLLSAQGKPLTASAMADE